MDSVVDYYLPSNDVDEDDNDWDYNITGTEETLEVIQENAVFHEAQSNCESPTKPAPLHSILCASSLPAAINVDSEDASPLISVTPVAEDSVGAYCCDLCSYTCDNKALLEAHTEKHTYTETLSCVYCSYRTISNVHFDRHLSDHEIEQQAVENGSEEPAFEDDWQVFYTGPQQPNSSISSNMGVETPATGSPVKIIRTKRKASSSSISANEKQSPKKNKSFEVHEDEREAIDALFRDTTATASLRYGKWRCSACDFSTKILDEIDQHLMSHNDFEGFPTIFEEKTDISMKFTDNITNISENVKQKVGKHRDNVGLSHGTLGSAGFATAKMWYKKWRCSCCSYRSKDESLMGKHLLTHNLNNAESHEENVSEIRRGLNHTSKITDEVSVGNSPLEMYLKKNTISVKSESLPSNVGNVENCVSPLKCPFCPTVSMNIVSHEKHIMVCHIYETERVDNDGSSPRVSLRPSTSRFKRAPNQMLEAGDNSFLQDYVMSLSDEDAATSPEQSKDVRPKKKKTRSPPVKTKSSKALTEKIVCPRKRERNKSAKSSIPQTSLDEAALLASSEKAGNVPVLPVANCPKWPELSEEELAAITLVCPICPFKSFMVHRFEAHFSKLHKNAVVYTCKRCSFVSLSHKEYLEHKKPHDISGISPITLCCPNCFSKTNYYHSFVRHAKYCLAITEEEGFHSNGNHICVFCKYRTCDLEMYKKHLLNHIKNEKLTCPKCPFETCRRDMYRLHLSLEHNLVARKLRCTQCSYTTTQQSQLNKHMYYKHNEDRKVRRPPIIKTYLPVDSAGKENEGSPAVAECPDDGDFDEFVDFSRVTDDFVGAGSSVSEEDEYLNSDEESLLSETKAHLETSCISRSSIASKKKSPTKSRSEQIRKQVKNTASVPKQSENICLFCSQEFNSPMSLGRHVKIHACEGTFTCPMCNFCSDKFKHLRSHFMDDHPEVLF
ncbi:Zinc finger C2H2-type [Trinorchestia longiramus]|nr:Zinc finger C2H2-type [Trinorchestia longiramus]